MGKLEASSCKGEESAVFAAGFGWAPPCHGVFYCVSSLVFFCKCFDTLLEDWCYVFLDFRPGFV